MYREIFTKANVLPMIAKFQLWLNDCKDDKQYVIEVREKKERRSLDANAYLWVLCDKIAIEMSKDGAEMYTREDIYRKAIKAVGVFKDYPYQADELLTLAIGWSNQGIGWLTEELDSGFRFYYGSSSYNTKQMKRLLDYVIADAKALGIETMTPTEIAKLEAEWNAEWNAVSCRVGT